MASSIKMFLVILVLKLQEMGILSLADEISEYFPDWGFQASKIVLLKKLKNDQFLYTVKGFELQNGVPVEIDVNLTKSTTDPRFVWTLDPADPDYISLEDLKNKLYKINRGIKIQDLLYHTSGIMSSAFYSNVSIFVSSVTDYTSTYKSAYNYPNTIGLSTLNPGDTINYDEGHRYLIGIIEGIFNRVVNGIELTIDSESDPRWMSITDIFSSIFDGPLGIERDIDYRFEPYAEGVGNGDYLARTSQIYTNTLERYGYRLNPIEGSFYDTLVRLKSEVNDTTDIFSTPFLPTTVESYAVEPGKGFADACLNTTINKVYPPGSRYSDITGVGGVASRKCYARITQMILNNGIAYDGSKFLSDNIMSLAYDPVHPSEMYQYVSQFTDGNGLPYTPTLFSLTAFGMILNAFNKGATLGGNFNIIDSGFRAQADIGANSSVTKVVKNQAFVIASYNTCNFWITLQGLISGNALVDCSPINSSTISKSLLVGHILTRSTRLFAQLNYISSDYQSGSILRGN
jgi:hypothetical protein